MKFDRPLFIVGSPRSGTTALRAALNTIPGVVLTHEWQNWREDVPCVPRIINKIKRIKTYHAENIEEVPREFGSRAEFVKALRRACPDSTPTRAVREWMYARCKEVPVVYGDKEPAFYLKYFLRTMQWWPNARWIFCTRNPVDACDSQIDVLRYNKKQALYWWEHLHLSWMAARSMLDRDQYQEVIYDKHSKDPELLVQRLGSWLGVKVPRPQDFAKIYKPVHIGRGRKNKHGLDFGRSMIDLARAFGYNLEYKP